MTPLDFDHVPTYVLLDAACSYDEDLVRRIYKCPAWCFAYVGVPGKPSTWKLPYLLADGTRPEASSQSYPIDIERLPLRGGLDSAEGYPRRPCTVGKWCYSTGEDTLPKGIGFRRSCANSSGAGSVGGVSVRSVVEKSEMAGMNRTPRHARTRNSEPEKRCTLGVSRSGCVTEEHKKLEGPGGGLINWKGLFVKRQ